MSKALETFARGFPQAKDTISLESGAAPRGGGRSSSSSRSKGEDGPY